MPSIFFYLTFDYSGQKIFLNIEIHSIGICVLTTNRNSSVAPSKSLAYWVSATMNRTLMTIQTRDLRVAFVTQTAFEGRFSNRWCAQLWLNRDHSTHSICATATSGRFDYRYFDHRYFDFALFLQFIVSLQRVDLCLLFIEHFIQIDNFAPHTLEQELDLIDVVGKWDQRFHFLRIYSTVK